MILVTGATGFIGDNLTKTLIEKGYAVSVLVRRPYNNIKTFIGDLNNKEVLDNATKNIDTIIHLAGISKGNVFEVNSKGTKNLVDAAVKNKVKRFIFISSYDVVKNTKYGKSKLKAENFIKNSGLNYIIFRPTVVYGRGNKKDIDKLIDLIKKFPLIPIPGKGNVKLQPLLLDDLIDLIIQGIKSKKKNKEYFVAGPEAISFNEIVNVISKTISQKIYKLYIPNILLFLINKSLLEDKVCNINEVKKDFTFNPKYFEEGIKLSFK